MVSGGGERLREAVGGGGWETRRICRTRATRRASVVRHEKMVIPSRMCPMHMHVFPQNGWPGCGMNGGGGRVNEVS